MKKDNIKAYQRNVKEIKHILSFKKELRKVFNDENIQKIEAVFNLIVEDMDELIQDKEIKATGKEKSRVKETVNLFLYVAVNQPIVPIFRDLSRELGLLIFNWNKVVGKRPDIEIEVLATRRIVDNQMTMLDAIMVLKSLTQRLKRLEQYSPPAFQLSKAYLKSLDEEV